MRKEYDTIHPFPRVRVRNDAHHARSVSEGARGVWLGVDDGHENRKQQQTVRESEDDAQEELAEKRDEHVTLRAAQEQHGEESGDGAVEHGDPMFSRHRRSLSSGVPGTSMNARPMCAA